MRITGTGATAAYYQAQARSGAGAKTNGSADSTHSAESGDALEISAAGKQAMEKANSSEKNYDLAAVMQIHAKRTQQEMPTPEESEYYWSARAGDPELDAQLYEQDKAEALSFVGKVQSILMKVASGQKLTAEEAEMVRSDPALAQEVQRRQSQSQLLQR